MTLTTIKNLKQELGFSNEWIAEKSGVPLGTVQKIFSEQVKSPRKETVEKLSHFFAMVLGDEERDAAMVHETELAYNAIKQNRVTYRTADGIIEEEDGVYRKPGGMFTIEDLAFLPEDKRMELIDGVLYEVNAPSWNHQRVIGGVFRQIAECIEKSGKNCEVVFAPLCVRVSRDNTTMVQPDLMIICSDDADKGGYVEGAPEFIMEVLSKSTRKKDMTVKLTKYWNSGVKEYWIADPKEKTVTVYDLEHGGKSRQYSFTDKVPVGISGGKCEVDFNRINDKQTPIKGEDW